ncbi:MAG: hypothetical protein KBA86_09200 [Bacteroidales bacterium]|nr:hypothetical protein [Bacteroidales bacterium]
MEKTILQSRDICSIKKNEVRTYQIDSGAYIVLYNPIRSGNILRLSGTIVLDGSTTNSNVLDKKLIYKSILFLDRQPQIISYKIDVIKNKAIAIDCKLDILKSKEIKKKLEIARKYNLSSGRSEDYYNKI